MQLVTEVKSMVQRKGRVQQVSLLFSTARDRVYGPPPPLSLHITILEGFPKLPMLIYPTHQELHGPVLVLSLPSSYAYHSRPH